MKSWKMEDTLSNTFYASFISREHTQPIFSITVVKATNKNVRIWQTFYRSAEQSNQTGSNKEFPRMNPKGSIKKI